ncbi:MAG: putative 2-aminoethylphosphonate ABC transporter substrate-binding protein [Rhodospirillales bacterium]|jgi:iron(III) transport system substrate-binding protein|nr:putative 2-aminoethylphosphonate ABC transporter substrate-binding protein [Rhodospirillales bacterium]
MKNSFTTIGKTLTAAIAVLAFGAGAADAQQRTRITVYTAIENEQLPVFKEAFEKVAPDVEIAWVRDSTGTIAARFLAEKDNPRADAIWGLSVTSLILFEQQGLLADYKPKGYDKLKPLFKDQTAPFTWHGIDAYAASICVNTAVAKAQNLPIPKTWADLVNPAYKGKIVMPNPASSGTGYLTVAAWQQIMGDAAAWQYMDKLHENVGVYLHSGSAPCVQAARGEYAIGISFDMRAASEKTKGAPVEIVVPTEGVGWDMEASAIVKTTKNMAAAQKLMDYSSSAEANRDLYSKYYNVVADPDAKGTAPNYPAETEARMLKIDLAAMANNRDKTLAEWSKRYDGKSAPK